MKTFTAHTQRETEQFAAEVAAMLQGGMILALTGDLGAGKTTFTKALAKALGVTVELGSPTFSLMNIYEVPSAKQGITTLVHIDTYRLKDEAELLAIGVEDYLGRPDTLSVIEWADKIPNILKKYKVVRLGIMSVGPQEREFRIDK